MWRSKVLDSIFFKCSRRRRPTLSLQNQVPPAQNSSLFQNIKFFSWTSNHNFENIESILNNSSIKFMVRSLDKMCPTLNEELIMRVTECPLVPGQGLIKFLKWGLKRPDFSINTQLLKCVVKVIGTGFKREEVFSLWELVKDIGEKEKGVLEIEILNQFIKLFRRSGRGQLGLQVLDKFEQFGCDPNPDSYYFTVEALFRCSMYDDAWTVCEKMIDAGKLPESWKIGHIVSCFCKCKKAEHAHFVYLMAKKKYERISLPSIKHLIHSLCRENDTVKFAAALLDELSGDRQKYVLELFSSVLCGLCRIRDMEGCKRLLFKMIREGPHPGNAVFNSVFTLLSKSGEMEGVMDLLYALEVRGLKPDVYTYCVIMSGYARKGQVKEAQTVLSEAEEKLDSVAYHILTRACCILEEFDKAFELLNKMDTGVQPNGDEYYEMIRSLCLEALDRRIAEKLLEEMKENSLHFSEVTLSLIRQVKELEEHGLNAEWKCSLAEPHNSQASCSVDGCN